MPLLTVGDIRVLCDSMDTTSSVKQSEAWLQLRELGPAVVSHLAGAYHRFRKWQGRVSCVFYLIRYARTHDEAFEVGVAALEDRATLVRYRACMLLANALRPEAIPQLRKLLNHNDKKTAEDAAAAIDAIENRNPNYFVDRMHTGRMFWSAAETPEALKELVEKPKKPWWKFW